MKDGKIALVTGATGGVGGAVAAALLRHGWRVRGLARRPMGPGAGIAGTGMAGRRIEWRQGDAMQPEDVMRATEGAALLFHGANPPGYRNWRGLALPMLRHAITAATAQGARLIYPGSVYVFGPDAWPRALEDAPQHPLTRKGAIRVEMEALLAEGAARGLRALTLRAGDFFGPHAPSSWVTRILLNGGQRQGRILTPERPGIRHSWAYLPDLAEAVAQLAAREPALAATETLHFAGHSLTGRAMAEAIARLSGGGLPIRAFPWALVFAAAPFNVTMRELLEMRYLWRQEITLENSRLRALLGTEPHTPLEQALEATIAGLRGSAAKEG